MKFKKPSKKYWIERTDKRMELAHRNANEVTAEVQRAYDKAIENINKDMDSILTNFSKLDGMTKDEAIKLLNERISKKRLDAIRTEIKTLPDGEIKTKLINKINAQAYRARMTRQQALKEKVQIECAKVADTELRASNKFYVKQMKETYYRNMFDVAQGLGYAIDFTVIPTKRIEEILKANWSGKNYSKRIWGNCETFSSKLEELLLKGAMEGKNSRVLAKELQEYANVGKHVSERLLRTETTYISTMADLEASKELDVEELEFVATLDSRTSPMCQQHDGKHIKVKDAKPGVNVPPLHCYCRSTTINVFEGLEHKTRFARDSKGNPIKVPADMKYAEWKEKFVKPDPEYSFKEKAEKNRLSDQRQYENYVKVLGKDFNPKDIDEFQRIKYTNAEEYNILKAQMRGMSYYNKAVECEPLITSSVKDISKTNNLDMLGLEYRIKTKDSYLGKIRRDYSTGNSGFEINDIIRYTYGADSSSLVEKTLSSIDDLKNKGYNTIRVKNSWLDKSNPYNGINTTVQAPNGQKFEIQYHTPESFELKNNELHKLYEEQRNILDEKSSRYIELEDKMYELSDKLQVPDNIGRVR